MLILWEEEVVCCLFTLTFTVHKLFIFLNWYLNSWVLLKMSEECRVQENSHGWFLFLHLLTHIAACGSFYGESWPSRSRWLLYKQHSWPITDGEVFETAAWAYLQQSKCQLWVNSSETCGDLKVFIAVLSWADWNFSSCSSTNEVSFTPHTPQNINF